MNPYMETAAILIGASIAGEAVILGGAMCVIKPQERYYTKRLLQRYSRAVDEYRSGRLPEEPKLEDFY